MSKFFESQQVQEDLQSIFNFYKEISSETVRLGIMDKEEKLEHIEDLQLTRYVAPDGHYDFHSDGNGHSRKNVDDSVRKLSMICLLSKSFMFDHLLYF